MTNNLSEFEIHVMMLALRGGDEWRVILRKQVEKLVVKERIIFPDGFILRFNFVGTDVGVEMSKDAGSRGKGYPPTVNCKYGDDGIATFVVWLNDDGYIHSLDASSLTGDVFPEFNEDNFRGFHDDMGFEIE